MYGDIIFEQKTSREQSFKKRIYFTKTIRVEVVLGAAKNRFNA